MSAGCQRVRPTSRSCANVHVVARDDDAGGLELLPSLPWLASDAAHRHTFEETAVARGVVRRDAAPVIEGLGAAESPAQTARTLIGCSPTRTCTAAKPCARRRDRAQLCFTANPWFCHGSFL